MSLVLTESVVRSPITNPRVEAKVYANNRVRRAARILVVDDELQIRSLMGVALGQQGYEVKLVSSEDEALEMLRGNAYDLVLADLMKSGCGHSLMERIHDQQPHLPVVMVTSVHEIGIVIETMRRGAYDYVLKPFECEHLLQTVQRALNYRKSIQENQTYRQNLELMVQARTEMLRQAMNDLEHSYDVTLEALGDALDLKDSETEGHSRRVTAYTVALARAMDINPVQIKIIARGAFLHDIGKMAIPDEILRKPGKLSHEERVIMRDHCARGYQILRKIPFLSDSSEIVYSHQEHFNGCGYPRGLRGDGIPVGARIFAVADALDAITSDRPYNKARSFSVARNEIQRCSGTQFDPEVVEVFLRIPATLWQDLRSEINNQNKRFSTFDITRITDPTVRLLSIS